MRSTAARFFTMPDNGPAGGRAASGANYDSRGGKHFCLDAAARSVHSCTATTEEDCDMAAGHAADLERDGRACDSFAAGNESVGAPPRSPRAQHVPRPVFVGSLLRAVYAAAGADHACSGGASPRIGESTILLDGAPCSMVTVCGRIIYKEGPFENGSFARFVETLTFPHAWRVEEAPRHCTDPFHPLWDPSAGGTTTGVKGHSLNQNTVPVGQLTGKAGIQTAYLPCTPRGGHTGGTRHPYSLFVLTDTTGTVGFLQYHTVRYGDEGEDPEVPSETKQTSAGALSGALRADQPGSTENEAAHGAGMSSSREVDGAVSDAAALVPGSCPSDSPQSTVFGGQPRAGAFANPHISAEELDFLVHDYVVATGRLTFADVDTSSLRCFDGGIGESLWAAQQLAAHDSNRCTSRNTVMNALVCPKISDMPPHPSQNPTGVTHVLLPGAQVPVALADYHELFGVDPTKGALPPGTQMLRLSPLLPSTSTEKGSDPNAAPEGAEESASLGAWLKDARGSGSLSPDDVVKFCVKGHMRLATSSNEMSYWALSAIETHARLTRTRSTKDKRM